MKKSILLHSFSYHPVLGLKAGHKDRSIHWQSQNTAQIFYYTKTIFISFVKVIQKTTTQKKQNKFP